MRSAAREVLSTPSCRLNAEARAKALAGIDGAANAVDEIAKLLSPAELRRRAS